MRCYLHLCSCGRCKNDRCPWPPLSNAWLEPRVLSRLQQPGHAQPRTKETPVPTPLWAFPAPPVLCPSIPTIPLSPSPSLSCPCPGSWPHHLPLNCLSSPAALLTPAPSLHMESQAAPTTPAAPGLPWLKMAHRTRSRSVIAHGTAGRDPPESPGPCCAMLHHAACTCQTLL